MTKVQTILTGKHLSVLFGFFSNSQLLTAGLSDRFHYVGGPGIGGGYYTSGTQSNILEDAACGHLPELGDRFNIYTVTVFFNSGMYRTWHEPMRAFYGHAKGYSIQYRCTSTRS